jgi:Domain of unknown function (DUF3819)
MVRCLAGSLAMVTCKEPLRSALAQHLRQLLQVCAPKSWQPAPPKPPASFQPLGRLSGEAVRGHELSQSLHALVAVAARHVLSVPCILPPQKQCRLRGQLCCTGAGTRGCNSQWGSNSCHHDSIHDIERCPQVPGLEPTALDNAVNTVTADNLDLGCRMIEKAAHDKAVTDIDARLAAGYAVRVSQPLYVAIAASCNQRRAAGWAMIVNKMSIMSLTIMAQPAARRCWKSCLQLLL